MIVKYTILFIYFAILFLIGIAASRKIKGLDDFFVGGKKLGFWVVAFSTRATGESAWLLLGLTGMGAMIGIKSFWVVLGELVGVGLAWFFMAKPFKRLTDQYESITIPDFFESHFKPKNNMLRIIAATALAIFVVIYVSAQIDATGQAFESFLEWNYYTGAIVGFVIVLAYSLIGGFVAVVWSDFFQGLLMLMGLIFLPIVCYINYPGESLFQDIGAISPALTNWWGEGGFTWLNMFSVLGLLCIGLGFLGSPQVFVRFMAVRDEKEIDKGRWVAMLFTVLADSGAVLVGLYARSIFEGSGVSLGEGGQDSLILLVEKYLPLVLVGIYIAVVLSAIMSTIDSLLVVASSAVTRDFYQKIFHPDLKQEKMAKLSRNITFLMSIFALIIAMLVAFLVPGRTIFWFVIFGWSGIAATFCPVIILALFWKKYNASGAIASMIAGFLSVPLFKFVFPAIAEIGPYFNAMEEMLPSFIVAFIAGIITTQITSKKKAIATQ